MANKYAYVVKVYNEKEARNVHDVWLKKNPHLDKWKDDYFTNIIKYPQYLHLSKDRRTYATLVIYRGDEIEKGNIDNPDDLTYKQFMNKFGNTSRYVKQLQFENVKELNFSYVIKLDKGKEKEQAKEIHKFWKNKVKNKKEWPEDFYNYLRNETFILPANPKGSFEYVMEGSSDIHNGQVINEHIYTFDEFKQKIMITSKYVRQLKFESLNEDKKKNVKVGDMLNIKGVELSYGAYFGDCEKVKVTKVEYGGDVQAQCKDSKGKERFQIFRIEDNFKVVPSSKYVRQLQFEEILEEEYTEDSVKEQLPKVRIMFNDEVYEGYIRTNTTEFAYVRIEDFPGTKFKFSWETVANSLNKDIPLETE